MNKQGFINAGFSVIGEDLGENELITFLKKRYPSVIKDGEIDLQELKAVAGLPVNEKTNGYGLNFVGKSFARAKYAKKTEKELCLNMALSKNIDTTQNLVLKGDNLDCLKILKNYYSGKIKCIYIDPPYNTDKDEFIYPDKFSKEEAEVLGLANLSEDDFARMEFSFKTKKSHNGWLAFMYPRLLLARDLLSKDGVIFISIDDNEQANLKLLCDEVFGEENFVAEIVWQRKRGRDNSAKWFSKSHEYLLVCAKNKEYFCVNLLKLDDNTVKAYKNPDNDVRGKYRMLAVWARGTQGGVKYDFTTKNGIYFSERLWLFSKDNLEKMDADDRLIVKGDNIYRKLFLNENKGKIPETIWSDVSNAANASDEIKSLFDGEILFDTAKPIPYLKEIFHISTNGNSNDIILDFFAGSGTTGHAVMQLNAEDGGNRKFILVQIDEPIKEDKPAYKFCIENNLPPVISSITIERLKRAGEKIKKEIEEENSKAGMFEEHKKQVPDIGFKVFDLIDAPKLSADDKGQIQFPELTNDALSRIYNMIFTIGLDEPTQVPEEVVKDCIYRIGNNYYITNSKNVSKEQFADCIKNGKVFIDGWTASLNETLQAYKEDVKIVF